MVDIKKIFQDHDDYLRGKGIKCLECWDRGTIWESGKGIMVCPKCGGKKSKKAKDDKLPA